MRQVRYSEKTDHSLDLLLFLNGLPLFTAELKNPLNSQDVTDTPLEFVPGQTIEGLNIVLTRKLTELSGQIAGERNAPDTDATVIVFSDNPDRWTFASRYIRTARPNQDGRYTLRGLPPHDYLVVAVKDVEPGQTQDPEYLESLRPQAVRVSLSEGESKVQDLKPGQ